MSDKQANPDRQPNRRDILLTEGSVLAISAVASGIATSAKAQAAGGKPNILVIFGDDIGYWNISEGGLWPLSCGRSQSGLMARYDGS